LINRSFGNNVAFGKSDLRFVLGDNIIEGNFGHQGTSFDTKGKSITDQLGGSKAKMLFYEIYSVEFRELWEMEALSVKKHI
jgi:hypothetical protein